MFMKMLPDFVVAMQVLTALGQVSTTLEAGLPTSSINDAVTQVLCRLMIRGTPFFAARDRAFGVESDC